MLAAPIAMVPMPAAAQTAEPTPQSDFSCFVLLAVRRAGYIANDQVPADQKAVIVRNLDVVMSFYQGRVSQYSTRGALQLFNNARTVVSQMTNEQREEQAKACARLYSAVDETTQKMGQGVDPAPR
ncbi:hypothetical protein [Novosphingopyxis sp.]|uniref:hypothetical protein n=1 Tax=Novosphingopyxis sp. TaxID=2709690 RepID=UPI003B5BFB42